MERAALLLTASAPDPKGAKAALLPFSVSRDGTLTTSTSGFVVLLRGGQPAVLTSAAAVYPLLPAARRTSLSGASHADLLPGASLTAAFCDGAGGACSAPAIHLRLAALAEVPYLRAALVQLLAAPSLAGPGGWQLGWLMQRPLQHSGTAAAGAALPTAAMLEVACHVAVLLPASPGDAAALRRLAVPLPAGGRRWDQDALQPGLAVTAVGAPFGCLAPSTFCSFQAGGVVAAVVPSLGGSSSSSSSSSYSGSGTVGCSSAGSGGSSPPALLLADLRCSPGMEGCPIFASVQATWSVAAPLPPLAGMLLPPLKAPPADVEIALVAPVGAVAQAAEGALRSGGPLPQGGSDASPSALAAGASAAAAAAQAAEAVGAALPAVVAVSAAGSWASGVIVGGSSSRLYVLTNAHALQPPVPLHQPELGGGDGPPSRQLQLRPAAVAAGDARTPVRVLLPGAAAPPSSVQSSGSGGGGAWAAAEVLYAFSGPLDLAVLRVRLPASRQPEWRLARLSQQPPAPGRRVCVAGYPVFSPRASPAGGPLVTAGTLAKVVRLPGAGQPAVLLTTAAVHSGASGGACLDAATGELLGLVTSNAKHTQRPPPGGAAAAGEGGRGAQVTVLPHLNFCVPAAQLAPVVAAAEAAAAGDAGDVAALAAWRAVDEAALASAELQQAWHLDSQRHKQQAEPPQQQPSPSGGECGGARPPARLQRVLAELRQRQEGEELQQQQQQQRSKL